MDVLLESGLVMDPAWLIFSASPLRGVSSASGRAFDRNGALYLSPGMTYP